MMLKLNKLRDWDSHVRFCEFRDIMYEVEGIKLRLFWAIGSNVSGAEWLDKNETNLGVIFFD